MAPKATITSGRDLKEFMCGLPLLLGASPLLVQANCHRQDDKAESALCITCLLPIKFHPLKAITIIHSSGESILLGNQSAGAILQNKTARVNLDP